MKNFKFSVLISIYKKESPIFFSQCLDSIVNQTFLPNEVIIIADGELTQDLYLIIDKYSQKLPIKMFQLYTNSGLGVALKLGIEHCNYNYIARVDSDDILFPNRFELQANFFINNNDISVLGTSMFEFYENKCNLVSKKIMPEFNFQIIDYSKYRNPINHPTVMFKKNDVLSSGSYSNIPFFEDYFLWFKMLKIGYKFHNLKEPLVYFRTNNNMYKRRSGIRYMIFEYKFLQMSYNLNFISFKFFIINLLIRLPIRLIPLYFFKLLYKYKLRTT